MRFRLLIIYATLNLVCGCGTRPIQPVTARGKPVTYWVDQLHKSRPKTRIAAVGALQSVGAADLAAIPALIATLSDPDAKVRGAAALALLNIGPAAKDATDAVRRALNDQDITVRRHAEAALKRIAPNG